MPVHLLQESGAEGVGNLKGRGQHPLRQRIESVFIRSDMPAAQGNRDSRFGRINLFGDVAGSCGGASRRPLAQTLASRRVLYCPRGERVPLAAYRYAEASGDPRLKTWRHPQLREILRARRNEEMPYPPSRQTQKA